MKRMIDAVKRFWQEEDGIGTVEMILILVVLIGLVVIFRDQLTTLINGIFERITTDSGAL
ncbi:MAG: holin, BlyA family protein [Lachnospiraceae bacterium]|nr:holin, BlyA family protein [Lachnospiraceae bacterium]